MDKQRKNMTFTKKLWIGIGILVVLSPLGLILPALFHAGGAWGEWGLEEIETIAGFVPEGMRRLSHVWKAPMTDYVLPGQGKGLVNEGLGYVLTGVIGVVSTAGVMYLLTKLLMRKNGQR